MGMQYSFTDKYAGRCLRKKEASNMKKINRLCLVLMILCLALLGAYRVYDRVRTDANPPEILFPEEELEVSVLDPRDALLEGISAADQEDGDVTSSLIVEQVKLADSDGTISITYAAFDSAGNVAKSVRTARYSDYNSPVISLSAPMAFPLSSGFDVLDVVKAEDVLDGDISQHIRATSLDKSSVTAQGTHDVEFKVTNSLGDTVTLILPVEVYPSGVYNATLTLTDYLIYLPQGAAFDAADYLNSFSYGASAASMRNGLPWNLSLKTTGEVNTQIPGVYSVGYTVSNDAYTGYTRLIVIVEG